MPYLSVLGAAALVLTVVATRPASVLGGFGIGMACIGLDYWLGERARTPRQRRVRTIIRLTPH